MRATKMRAVKRIGAVLVAVAALVVTMLSAVPATAGPPGTWTKLPGTATSIDDAAMLRTSDGVLHVFYRQVLGSLSENIMEARISPAGKVLGSGLVLTPSWVTVNQHLRAIALPDGAVGVVFSGMKTTNPGETYDGSQVYYTKRAGASAWSTPRAVSVNSNVSGGNGSPYGAYGLGAVTLGDGSPMAAWVLNGGLYWNSGDHPATASGSAATNNVANFSGASLYDATLAISGGAVYAGWYALGNSTANEGIFVKKLRPAGAPVQLPGSVTTYGGQKASLTSGGPIAMTAFGSGVAVAYCTGYPKCTAIKVWRSDTGRTVSVPGSYDASTSIALAAAPGNRLWVAWHKYGDNHVNVTRSAAGGGTFGAVRTLSAPAQSVYRIFLEARTGVADVVVADGGNMRHQQVVPGLSLKASAKKVSKKKPKKITFTVTDAGAPVKGAKVTAPGKKSCVTKASGKCKIKLGKAGKVTASASGYAPATVNLKKGK